MYVVEMILLPGLKLQDAFIKVKQTLGKQVDDAERFQTFTSEDICFLSCLYLG